LLAATACAADKQSNAKASDSTQASSATSTGAQASPRLVNVSAAAPKLEDFAKCLAQKKATMYGAFWCSHCKEQKDLLGSAWVYVPYVECAVPGKPPRTQTPACVARQIRQYPTWIFADGQRKVGLLKLDDLSAVSGCPLK
jgi:hypothetical protein